VRNLSCCVSNQRSAQKPFIFEGSNNTSLIHTYINTNSYSPKNRENESEALIRCMSSLHFTTYSDSSLCVVDRQINTYVKFLHDPLYQKVLKYLHFSPSCPESKKVDVFETHCSIHYYAARKSLVIILKSITKSHRSWLFCLVTVLNAEILLIAIIASVVGAAVLIVVVICHRSHRLQVSQVIYDAHITRSHGSARVL